MGDLATLRRDYDTVIDRGDGTYVAIYPLMFHWTMIMGAIGLDTYDERWCYGNRDMAAEALEEWMDRGWEGEPTGWNRHPPSGRRRICGDPETEYIEY